MLLMILLLLLPGWGPPVPVESSWVWLSAARRAAFSTRNWSTRARHSSQRLLASSADAKAASRSCERDSSALTCLAEESRTDQDKNTGSAMRYILVSSLPESTLCLSILLRALAGAECPACSRIRRRRLGIVLMVLGGLGRGWGHAAWGIICVLVTGWEWRWWPLHGVHHGMRRRQYVHGLGRG